MTAQHSRRTQFLREDDVVAATYNAVGEVTGITGPDGQASVLDVTNLDSTFVTKLAGLPDAGNFSITLNVDQDDTEQDNLYDDWVNQTIKNYQVTYDDPANPGTPKSTLTFAGNVLSFERDAPQNQPLTINMTLLILGVITKT